MSTVQRSVPAEDSAVTPLDPDRHRFRTGRVVLLAEAAVLAVLGGWGLLANAVTAGPGSTGAPVLIFHLTSTHSGLLLGTGLLALIAARRRRTALIFLIAQFFGYLLLFTAGSVAYAREVSTPLGLDVGDLVGYLVLIVLAAALTMWVSGQGLEGRWWGRTRRAAGTPGAAPAARTPETVRVQAGSAGHSAGPDLSDAYRFGPGLQDESKLERAKLAAGTVTVVALVAMFVTSLIRAPEPAASVVLAFLSLALLVALGVRLVHRRGARRPR